MATTNSALRPLWEVIRSGVALVAGIAIAGGLSTAALGPAMLVSIGCLVIALCVAIWNRASFTRAAVGAVILGLGTLSYGFNNIYLPGLPIPVVEAMVVAVPLAAGVAWPGRMKDSLILLRPAVGWFIAFVAVGAIRLALDVPRHGLLAVRDATIVWQPLWILGVSTAVLGTTQRSRRLFVATVIVAVTAWACLQPLETILTSVSPVVGFNRPIHLLSFASSSWLAPIAFLYAVRRRGRLWTMVAGAALFGVLVGQSRAVYLLLPIAWLIQSRLDGGLPVAARRGPESPLRRRQFGPLLAAGIVGLLVLVVIQPSVGRVGRVDVSTLTSQFVSLRLDPGQVGTGALEDRLEWWGRTLSESRVGLRSVGGRGFGVDLIPEFRGLHGQSVRKPHNDWLEAFARMGVIGLVAWLGLVVSLILLAVRRMPSLPPDLGAWPLVSAGFLLTISLVQPLFAFSYGSVIFYSLIALAVVPSGHYADDSVRARRVDS